MLKLTSYAHTIVPGELDFHSTEKLKQQIFDEWILPLNRKVSALQVVAFGTL